MLVVTSSVDGQISTEFLGTNGLFVAIIIGLIVVEVARLVEVRNWKISMPDTVPPAVTTFVNSMLPLLLNIILIYGKFDHSLTGTFPQFMLLLTPALFFGKLAIHRDRHIR
jgi:PTS system cellobiose-specific IIC component